MFIGSQFDSTFGASDMTKSSAFCVCCVVLAIFGRMLWVRVELLLKEQSDLAPHRLQIYANNTNRYICGRRMGRCNTFVCRYFLFM